VSDAVRRPCSDFMDMLRRLINYRIIIIIIINQSIFFQSGLSIKQLLQGPHREEQLKQHFYRTTERLNSGGRNKCITMLEHR